MQYTLSPTTFFVNEVFNPELKEDGKWNYYVLQKRGVSHKEAVQRIKNLGCTPFFCGIKDRNATTRQWFCARERIEDDTEDENFKVTFKGCADERIHVGSHKANSFVIIAQATADEQKALRLFKAKKELVGNYFGEQRFDARVAQLCALLEKEEYENALKVFLTEKSKFDSEKSTAMKNAIAKHWGQWEKVVTLPEIKDTKKRPIFDFLQSNTEKYKEAFAFVEPKSLKILLKSWQAERFNKMLSAYALTKKPNTIFGTIHGEKLALSASKAFTRELSVEPNAFETQYLRSALHRKTFFEAKKFTMKKKEGTHVEFRFELPRGSYATVFLVFLENWLVKNKK